LGDVLSQHRAVRFECGEVFLEGREALSPHREALHEGRAVIQPHRAVRALFRDDRSAFVEDLSLFAAALEGIQQGSSQHARLLSLLRTVLCKSSFRTQETRATDASIRRLAVACAVGDGFI
jgi:hypothetical protein